MNSGDIVLVHFPFTSLETTKKRPALILRQTSLGRRSQIFTVAMISSQIEGIKMEEDVYLKGWEEAKLLYPSLVRLSKIATIEGELIEKVLGTVNKTDLNEIKKAFQQLYRFWLKG